MKESSDAAAIPRVVIKGLETTVRNNRWSHFLNGLGGFPSIVDDLPGALCGRRTSRDVVYVRAELPADKSLFSGPCYPLPHTIMLAVKENAGLLHLTQVPAVHDLFGERERSRDPYELFRTVLSYGFHAGTSFGSVLLGTDAFSDFWRYEAQYGVHAGKVTESLLRDTHGDRYRLVLWTGFTSEYEHSASRGVAYASVVHTPPALIEPFVVLDSSRLGRTGIERQIEFYLRDLKGFGLTVPVRFVDRARNYCEVYPAKDGAIK